MRSSPKLTNFLIPHYRPPLGRDFGVDCRRRRRHRWGVNYDAGAPEKKQRACAAAAYILMRCQY